MSASAAAPDRGTQLGTLPPDEIAALLAAMDQGVPWRAALADLPLPVAARKPDWFTNESKAAFYLALPTPSDGLAIDVGAGAGVIAGALTKRFQRVVAIERDPAWCRFIRRRFTEDGVNVDVIEHSGFDVPLPAAIADLIVVNGVLEWVACDDDPLRRDSSPRDVQVEFLRGMLRLLRQRGRIAIAIENRFHFANFRGGRPHGEPAYAAILPRRIADRLSRAKLGVPYRTWIYGSSGYERLLHSAGFVDVQLFAALPDYHQPRMALPLSDGTAIRARVGPRGGVKGRVFDVLGRIGVIGQLVHSFYISAERR